MKFKSKIDWWYHAVTVVLLSCTVWMVLRFVAEKSIFIGIAGIALIAANALIVIPIWLNTSYYLSDSSLIIKCGLGKPLQIPYKDIINVKSTKSLLASSALSLDRLEISYRKNNENALVFISPRNKKGFAEIINSRRK